MSAVTFSQTVDAGHGRGRLVPEHAASLRRVDAQLGRPLDTNSLWRDPTEQGKLRRAWLAWDAYQRGVGPVAPWAPYALEPDESVHCAGGAADTDEWTDPAVVTVLNDNGWFQTVRWPDGSLREGWHFDRQRDRDNHRNETAASGSTTEEEDDMYTDEDRARDIKTKERVDAVYAAMFGPANVDAGELSWYSVDQIDGKNVVKRAKYGLLDIDINTQRLAAQAARDAAAILKLGDDIP